MHKRTKIISTVGPSTNSSTLLKKLYDKGMNVIRINMSHTSIMDMRKIIDEIKALNKKILLLSV
jgi:Pyruvate kinase